MIATIIYPKELAFPFNIACIGECNQANKMKFAERVTECLMGDGWETETPVSKNLEVRPMRFGDMILFPDGETWAVGKDDFFLLDRRKMIDFQIFPSYSHN